MVLRSVIIKLLLAVFCMAMLMIAIQTFNKYGFSFSLKQKQPLICKIRSQSQTILKESSKIDFGLNNYCRPIKYIENRCRAVLSPQPAQEENSASPTL